MMAVEKEDWIELVRILREVEENTAAFGIGGCGEEMERSRQALQSFHTTAAMLGMADLERAGLELERFLSRMEPGGNVDEVSVFGLAISSLAEGMQAAGESTGAASVDVDEILEALGPGDAGGTAGAFAAEGFSPARPPVPAKQRAGGPFGRLEEVVRSLGGELSFASNGRADGKFSITFSGPAESLEKLEALLAGEKSETSADPGCDMRIEKVIARGKEFMEAFSEGNILRAQDILQSLAEQQSQPGLYKEIGGLARELHDSIRGFLNTMDPSLREIVEDKIPDSGYRLEHMLELTEKAAITTLDHVEAMQDRLAWEQDNLARLRDLLEGLKAIGDGAEKKLEEGGEILAALERLAAEHRKDLDAILTAQDYQDLSGQIIQKITTLLKDLERKLVNMIRTFGVKVETKADGEDELYGPAHMGREDAVHSQDEVDSLLAEFGF